MTWAREVLPNPGGPTSRAWSNFLESAKAASTATFTWSTTERWPTMWLREVGVTSLISGCSATATPCFRLSAFRPCTGQNLLTPGASRNRLANNQHQLVHVVGVSALMDLVSYVELLRLQLPPGSVPIPLGIGGAFPDGNRAGELFARGSVQDCLYVVPGHLGTPFVGFSVRLTLLGRRKCQPFSR